MIKTAAKWKVIYDTLVLELDAGEFSQGDTFYTLREICERFEVSDITARRIFKELQSNSYISTTGSRNAIVNICPKGMVLNFCLPDSVFIDGDFNVFSKYQQILEGINSEGQSEGISCQPVSLSVMLENSGKFSNSPMLVSSDVFLDISKDYISLNYKLVDRIKDDFAAIVIDGFSALDGFPQLNIDYHKAVSLAVDFLVEEGHRNIGFISGPVEPFRVKDFFAGYVDGLYANNIMFNPEWMKIWDGRDMQKDIKAFVELLNKKDKPTAVICSSDRRALDLMKYCEAKNIAVPDQLAAIGFGDISEAAICSTPLTTLDCQYNLLGKSAYRLFMKKLTGRLNESSIPVHEIKLIKRSSV
ncbi:MAG: substrate-binding domain-containing protein [Planctomycetota bacterium]|jgi:DNA-binding LacI/PurR family transcriptional regulator